MENVDPSFPEPLGDLFGQLDAGQSQFLQPVSPKSVEAKPKEVDGKTAPGPCHGRVVRFDVFDRLGDLQIVLLLRHENATRDRASDEFVTRGGDAVDVMPEAGIDVVWGIDEGQEGCAQRAIDEDIEVVARAVSLFDEFEGTLDVVVTFLDRGAAHQTEDDGRIFIRLELILEVTKTDRTIRVATDFDDLDARQIPTLVKGVMTLLTAENDWIAAWVSLQLHCHPMMDSPKVVLGAARADISPKRFIEGVASPELLEDIHDLQLLLEHVNGVLSALLRVAQMVQKKLVEHRIELSFEIKIVSITHVVIGDRSKVLGIGSDVAVEFILGLGRPGRTIHGGGRHDEDGWMRYSLMEKTGSM